MHPRRVILSAVPSWAKAGRNGVEGPLILSPDAHTAAEKVRGPSTPLRPLFRLRSAQDDSLFWRRVRFAQ